MSQKPSNYQSMAEQYLDHKNSFTNWMESLTRRVHTGSVIESETEIDSVDNKA